MNTNTFRLVGKIKGLAEETKYINVHPIKKVEKSGYDSGQMWTQCIKHELRLDARHHLLAYAFIRHIKHKNTPYSRLEQKCDAKPSVAKLVKIVLDHTPLTYCYVSSDGIKRQSLSWYNEAQLTEKITAWLAGAL